MATVWKVKRKVMDTEVTKCTCGFKGYHNHKGADLIPKSTDETPNILAFADGVVIFTQNYKGENSSTGTEGMGTSVCIKLTDGSNVICRYQHLKYNSIKVSVGDKVVKGQSLARYGRPATGNASGCHLHYDMSFPTSKPNAIKSSFMGETRYYVDPYPFLMETEFTDGSAMYKVLHDVNIRESNSTKAKIVGEYKKGEKVKVIKTSGVWVKTSKGWCNNNNGYFFSKL